MTEAILAAGGLAPNAVLVLAAIGASDIPGRCSRKTDDIGYMVGANAAWVRRHGAALEALGLGHLSRNGHCWLEGDGPRIALRLRAEAVVGEAPRAGCWWCGARIASGVSGGRVLHDCGAVAQWCGPAIPWLPAPEISPRSRRSQHGGRWFRVSSCGGEFRGRHAPRLKATTTAVGTPLVAGTRVTASRSSGFRRGAPGTIVAAANGTALVDWDACGELPAEPGAICDALALLAIGDGDAHGLTDYQTRLWRSIRSSRTELSLGVVGNWLGQFEGRAIPLKAIEALQERGLLERPDLGNLLDAA